MRLRHAAVAAVLASGSLAGLATVVAPAGAALAPAAKHAVTAITIDRAGHRVSELIQLENLDTGTIYTLASGKASMVPDGSYNLGVMIQTPGKTSEDIPSYTLVDRQLTVSKPVTVTLDARPGRRVRFTINDPRATVNATFLVTGSPVTGFEFSGGATPVMYAVPGNLPSGWNLYAMGTLSSVTAAGWPVEYELIRVVNGHIPAGATWFSSVSKLTTLHATLRRLNPGGSASITLTPEVSGPANPLWPLGGASTGYFGAAPYTVQFRLTPGYAWQQFGPYEEELLNNLPILGAHQYHKTFGAATFSPNWAAEQAVEVNGKTLGFGTANGQWMLEDPTLATVPDSNSEGLPASETAVLYQGGKLIASSSDKGGSVTIPAVTKWYREVVVAKPESGGRMFGRVTLDYTFPAAAQPDQGTYVPDYIVPAIRPTGLNADNGAEPGTKTTVPIQLVYGVADHSVAVHSVQVWASGDGGKAWTVLRVSHRGGTWTVTVTNPAKAGYVSLRVRAALSNGVTTQVTVINAYAVT